MSWYGWLLFLHVLAAFVTVAAVVLFGALVIGTRRAGSARDALPLLRLSGLATLLWNVGGGGVLVLGVALAIYVDGYRLLDGWILAAIVLWVIASAAGGPLGRGYRQALVARTADGHTGPEAVRPRRALALYAVTAASTAALLADMIFKPGA